MINNSDAIKNRLKENIEQQRKMVEQALMEGSKERAMFHTGHIRGLQNSIALIEIFEKGTNTNG